MEKLTLYILFGRATHHRLIIVFKALKLIGSKHYCSLSYSNVQEPNSNCRHIPSKVKRA